MDTRGSFRAACLRWGWLVCLGLPMLALAQNAPRPDPAETLLRVLAEYRVHSEFFDYLPAGKDSFPVRTKEELGRLEPSVQKTRYDEFNAKYLNFKRTLGIFLEQQATLQRRFDNTALSDIKAKSEVDARLKIQGRRVREAKRTLFLISLDANHSITDALATLSPAAKKQLEKDQKQAQAPQTPKMPGRYQGSRWDFEQQSDSADRLSIVPFDKEFEDSQLGQKIQKDLGGKVDFWSYDFDTDELFVKVGDQISKLRVREDGGSGVRFIQTRVGSGFFTPKGADEQVDENKAKGKFLAPKSEKKNQETLFGERDTSGPKFAEELPPGHSKHDGHNHSH